jgi:hypothetical protein
MKRISATLCLLMLTAPVYGTQSVRSFNLSTGVIGGGCNDIALHNGDLYVTAGGRTILKTSIPLFQCDGVRLSSNGEFLLVERQGRLDSPNLKMGRVDEVTTDGDKATTNVIKEEFELPTAVTSAGSTIYVLERKLAYHRRAELKSKNPGAFYANAIPLNIRHP